MEVARLITQGQNLARTAKLNYILQQPAVLDIFFNQLTHRSVKFFFKTFWQISCHKSWNIEMMFSFFIRVQINWEWMFHNFDKPFFYMNVFMLFQTGFEGESFSTMIAFIGISSLKFNFLPLFSLFISFYSLSLFYN